MARNEKDEEIAAIYAQHKEAFHDETVGFNRGRGLRVTLSRR